jgi:hypothetical protein
MLLTNYQMSILSIGLGGARQEKLSAVLVITLVGHQDRYAGHMRFGRMEMLDERTYTQSLALQHDELDRPKVNRRGH